MDITTDILTSQLNLQMAEDQDVFELEIQGFFKELFDKEDGIYWFYNNNEKNIQLINEHIDKCNKIKKQLKNGNERMKQLVISCNQETGTMPKNSIFNPLKVRESGGAVDVIDESKIPDYYWVEIITKRIDKKRILKDLKKGTEVPGVRLVKKDFIGGLK